MVKSYSRMSVVMPLMEEYSRLRVFANMVLMKMFRPKRDEVEIAYLGASRLVVVGVAVVFRVCLDSWRSFRGFSRQELLSRSGLPLPLPSPDIYSSLNISQVIIPRRMRCTGLVAYTGERRGEVH
jgi:hypothetical protein